MEDQIHGPDEFADEEGESAVAWQDLPPDRDFFAYPYNPPIKSLVQEIRDDELVVRPNFQRNGVWDRRRKCKFIESILMKIPIPTLFFANDEGKKVVIDGRQRLLALEEYLDNTYALSGLEVLAQLNGKRFDELTERQQRIINNRTLRCLVISDKTDSEIRFQVFERLNQGGVPLNAQEVRHYAYSGELNDLLHELARHANWLRLYGREEPHPRMVDCELILRFFAIRNALPNYMPPLKRLLNDYMRNQRHLVPEQITDLSTAFVKAISGVDVVFGDRPFRRTKVLNDQSEYDRNINRAIFDIQMVTSELLSMQWQANNRKQIREAFQSLCQSDEKFVDSISRATADKRRFDYRLNAWASALRRLGADFSSCTLIPDAPER